MTVEEPTASVAAAPRRSIVLWAVLVAAFALWLLACWPLLTGSRTLFRRDLFSFFLPLRAFGAETLRQGLVPALDPAMGVGQPFRGDPNAAAFYPTSWLYLVMPLWIAFNFHLCLHWLLAGVAMGVLARAMGHSEEGATLAALAYGGGFLVSCLLFYVTVAVVAWWPLVLWGAWRGGRRGVAVGGLCCGMALLAGEPVLVALGVVPLLGLGVTRWGWRRGLGVALAIVALGALVALPQLVALLRVLPSSFRSSHGVLASQAGSYRLAPWRLAQLVAPLPAGAQEPYFVTLYPGVVATFLALVGAVSRRGLATLGAMGVLVAWAPGVPGALLSKLSLGLVRFPEKALFWLALALPLLAAAGLDRLRARPSPRLACSAVLAGAALLTAAAMALRGERAEPASALALAGLLLLLAAWGVWRQRFAVVLCAQLAALVPLLGSLASEPVSAYARPAPWTRLLDGRRAVLAVAFSYPPWRLDAPAGPRGTRQRAFELAPVPGVLQGLTYPLAPDIDGLQHRLFDYLSFRLSQEGWPARLAWLRVLGVEALVAPEPIASSDAMLLAAQRWDVGATFLYALARPAPAVWWPARVQVSATPAAAFAALVASTDPTATAVVPLALRHAPAGRIRLVAMQPDRVVIDTATGGGLLVVRRAYQEIWRAYAGGHPLPVLPADLALTGIVVPPGRQRVTLLVESGPEIAGGLAAAVVALALLAAAAWPSRRSLPAPLS